MGNLVRKLESTLLLLLKYVICKHEVLSCCFDHLLLIAKALCCFRDRCFVHIRQLEASSCEFAANATVLTAIGQAILILRILEGLRGLNGHHVQVLCATKYICEYRLNTLLGLLPVDLYPRIGVSLYLVRRVVHKLCSSELAGIDRGSLLDWLLLLVSRRQFLLNLVIVLTLLRHALMIILVVIIFLLLFDLEPAALLDRWPMRHVTHLY